jgi:cytidine deaminase
MEENEKINTLCVLASRARERAYALVTGIKFGAALVTKSGKIYAGANIEDWSLTLTRHAEMCAIDRMLFNSKCEEDKIIDVIVVVGDQASLNLIEPILPCGLCRSYIARFSTKDTIVIAKDINGSAKTVLIGDIIPGRAFKKMNEENIK